MAGNIRIRKLGDFSDFERLIHIQKTVWNHHDIDLTPIHQFCISSRMGAILLGAFVDGILAGFVYSFPAIHDGKWVQHSHLLAVLPGYQGRGIGKALKAAQRREALKRGFDLITWTFDPLRAKNANLNLHTLGAASRTYWPNFYGHISSLRLEPEIPTDRLLAEWNIKKSDKKNRAAAAGGKPKALRISDVDSAAVALERAKERKTSFPGPGRTRLDLKSRTVFAEIPPEVSSDRLNSSLIKAWQSSLRRVLQTYFKRGYVAKDFIFGPHCFYVLKNETQVKKRMTG